MCVSVKVVAEELSMSLEYVRKVIEENKMTGKNKFNYIVRKMIDNGDLTTCDFPVFDGIVAIRYYDQASKIDERFLDTYAIGNMKEFDIITKMFGVEELSDYLVKNKVEKVECTVCGDLTNKLGTKLCDRCWELKSRIERHPTLAMKILGELDKVLIEME